MLKKYHHIIAALMLFAMLMLGLFSMAGDSGIVDEVAHIPAGYSYLKYGDFRLNPEHPPLLKDMAAFPLLFMDLDFPDDLPDWTTIPNGQWETGWHFIYHYGNNADQILFWSRLPLLLLTIAFGWVLYRFVLKRFGPEMSLLSLFLFAFSPNLIAHAKFVTTDLGIAAFTFFSLITFVKFIESPSKKTLLLAGVFLGLANLAKFSAVILYPFYGIMAVIVLLAFKKDPLKQRLKVYLGGLVLMFIISGLLTWIFYIPHTINMPLDVQDRLIESSLSFGIGNSFVGILTGINHLPGMKSIVQYLLGVLMVFNRVEGGNTTYFLGQVTNQSFLYYFPVTYLIKTPLGAIVLNIIAAAIGLIAYFRRDWFRFATHFFNYARSNFLELTLLLFIVLYSYLSITGNLNLGIRHLAPIIPLIGIMTAKKIAALSLTRWKVIIGLMVAWHVGATLWIHPSYVAYMNEAFGGPSSGDKYISDSSLDWGQDLKRLVAYVDSHPEIDKIAVDYFGGGDPRYYFCDRKYDVAGNLIKNVNGYDCANSPYIEWHAEDGRPPAKYIAVSETFLMNDIYWSGLRGDEGYGYLRAMQPVAKIGYSIYLYKI